jgi:hypothetical protein
VPEIAADDDSQRPSHVQPGSDYVDVHSLDVKRIRCGPPRVANDTGRTALESPDALETVVRALAY